MFVTRTTRRKVTIATLSVVVIFAALAYATWLREEDGLADPASVELPDAPADTTATLGFLNGPDGAPLLQAVDLTASLAEATSISACIAILGRLEEVGSPHELFAAALGIPDSAMSEMVINHLNAAAKYLGSCMAGSEVDPEESAFTGEVLRRRLEQLG